MVNISALFLAIMLTVQSFFWSFGKISIDDSFLDAIGPPLVLVINKSPTPRLHAQKSVTAVDPQRLLTTLVDLSIDRPLTSAPSCQIAVVPVYNAAYVR